MDIDLESIQTVVSAGLSHQVTQWITALGIAAWIHSGRVKKEIKAQMGAMVDAINSLGDTLRKDMAADRERIGRVEMGFGILTMRLDKIETKKGE